MKLLKKGLLFSLSLLFVFTLSSCNNEKDEHFNEDVEFEEILSQVRFANIDALLENYPETRASLEQNIYKPELSTSGLSLIIVKFSIGRGANCRRAWGFCQVEWFPFFSYAQKLEDNYAIVEYNNSNGEYNLKTLLADEIPAGITQKDLLLEVTNDIVLRKADLERIQRESKITTLTPNKDLILKAGTYEVANIKTGTSSSLGYSIKLQ